MIGYIILLGIAALIIRWYISVRKRFKLAVLVDAQSTGKPKVIPYEDPIYGTLRILWFMISGSRVPDFEFMPQFVKKWQNSAHAMQFVFMGIPIILSWDPQAAREVASKPEIFRKASNFNHILDRLAGQGVLMVEGEQWSKQRRISQLKTIFPAFVQSANLLINAMKEELKENGGFIKPYPLMTAMTMEAIGKAGFGFDFGSFNKDTGLELQSYKFIIEKLIDPKYLFKIVFKLPTAENKKLEESFQSFNKLVRDLIAKKIAQPKLEGEASDLLEMMITANENGAKLSDEELLHNINTFFIAGHETSASSLTSALYLLATNVDAQNKAREEAKTILGGRDPTYEDITHLTYLPVVLKEVLRMYPPLLGFSRMAAEDCVVNGYLIPKGTLFSALSLIPQRSAEYYEDPDLFKPDRWLGKENDGETKNNMPWYPFAAGPRMCIGNHFSMLEMKATLVMLLQKFKFTPKSELKFQRALTLRPVDSFTIGVEEL